VNDNRPVNLSLTAFRWPITALVSITHRVSGVALYAGILVLLWLWGESLGMTGHAFLPHGDGHWPFGDGFWHWGKLAGGTPRSGDRPGRGCHLHRLSGGVGMVTAVTSFGRSGLYDWLIQRVTAVVLAIYTFFIVGYLLANPDLTYSQWSGLFSVFWMRLFSLAALLSAAVHAWIGLWSVVTDYLTPLTLGKSATVIRLTVQMILGGVTLAFTLWGIDILWAI